MHLLDLPYALIDNILSYFTFDEISKLREISRDFNQICKKILNKGFYKIERNVIAFHARLRARLPRRESERRLCPLNRHCEAISAVENRVSLLKICIMRNIKDDRYCFFPGKILDEIENTCRVITTLLDSPIQTVDILRELRDLSSMAMEYFEEQLLPRMRSKSVTGCLWGLKTPTTSNVEPPLILSSGPVPVEELLAVSDYKSKQNQIHSAVCQDKFHHQPVDQSNTTEDSKYLHGQIKRLRRSQSLSAMRIRHLHCVLFSLRHKQRQLSEQNKRLGELLVAQNIRLQKLEQAHSQSLNQDSEQHLVEPLVNENNGHSHSVASLKRCLPEHIASEESESNGSKVKQSKLL